MWKDFVAINGSECVRALTCIAIDDPLGGHAIVCQCNDIRSVYVRKMADNVV